jgi:hypothetical protein
VDLREPEAGLPEPSYDLAFIDGAHDYPSVMADVQKALRVLSPGGRLAFHDYRLAPGEYDGRWDEGVTLAVNSLLDCGAKLLSRHGSVAVIDPANLRAPQPAPAAADDKPLVALAMARRGREIADDAAAEGFYRFPCKRCQISVLVKPISTILPDCFNQAWAGVLNLRDSGVPVKYFAMIHDDIGPAPWWVDTLVDELERLGADIVSTVFPIKTQRGLTTTAVNTGDLWLPRRLTMTEVHELPETFGEEEVEGPLLLGSGLWVADITKPWVDAIDVAPGEVGDAPFDFQTRIRRTADGTRVSEVIPEDWLFSHRAYEAGAKLYATRKVKVDHSGTSDYPNDMAWGQWKTDEVYRQRNAKKERELCESNS